MDYGQIAVKIMNENILNDPFSCLLTRVSCHIPYKWNRREIIAIPTQGKVVPLPTLALYTVYKNYNKRKLKMLHFPSDFYIFSIWGDVIAIGNLIIY